MKRRIAIGALAFVFAVPFNASAKPDATCSSTTITSAIAGVAKDAKGNAVAGLTVELFPTNDNRPIADRATTDVFGRYRICVGSSGAAGHNTYDVHIRDLRTPSLFAGANQPYTTYTNLGDADFTPESGLPMLYTTNLTITPNQISTATGAVSVSWVVRSKAPATTSMKLTLDHITGGAFTMAPPVAENGGPAAGGWNRWTFTDSFPQGSTEKLYFASVGGFDGAARTTQTDRQPYVIDNQAPLFGLASSSTAECGPGYGANAFSPASPPGTTNPQPIVSLGVCDRHSNGARSGLDPFSLTGKICATEALTGCTAIDPVLSTTTIVWWPRTPLALGDYYFGFRISDLAGNAVANPLGYKLTVTDRGGQTPVFSSVSPSNIGSGSTLGVVVGSSLTSPNSLPSVGFRLSDADGQLDIVPGSLRVRVYYMDESRMVYDYDPALAPNDYNAVTGKGGAMFDLSQGIFRATGYTLSLKTPGRYIATASVTDHGTNSASMTWQWVLAAAV